jgi:hypothetical protein
MMTATKPIALNLIPLSRNIIFVKGFGWTIVQALPLWMLLSAFFRPFRSSARAMMISRRAERTKKSARNMVGRSVREGRVMFLWNIQECHFIGGSATAQMPHL